MHGEAAPDKFGNRYYLIEPLGRGGMGAVYRAKDRLGGHVALKRIVSRREQFSSGMVGAPRQRAEPQAATITVPRDMLSGVASLDSQPDLFATVYGTAEISLSGTQAARDADAVDAAALLSLAREFRVLASLRHPNIISVLDYGFDEELLPYYTMELLERAQTIVEAGKEQSFAGKLGLLAEMLHALVYLHRRGVIHRDLKPANVMVEGGRVKLLDFGIATIREELGDGFDGMGTLAYISPEVLCFEPATELSDLYAVGLIGYELFAGSYPFSLHDSSLLRTEIIGHAPSVDGIDARIAPVIERLLAKNPAHRFASASEVLERLRQVSGVPLPMETAATRESFLQAAELVSRDEELGRLFDLLVGSRAGHGSGVLLGGESGVGKSRLLEELRAHALVEGVFVLRGQCVSEGGGPLHPFRDVLRWLALLVEPDEYEAGVLKTVIPDIGAVLEREVVDAAPLEADAAQVRLLNVIEDLLRRQQQPALIVLEDLHWAPSESLQLLARVCRAAQDLRLLVVGSYRDDEWPDLPRELPMMKTLRLGRLPRRGIEALCGSMLGDAGSRPELVELLARETEGNPFFLVEVVRALAEEAGELGRVGSTPLPERVGAGGLQRIVQRRIERVPVPARPLLLVAAVIGRQIDSLLLRVIAPDVDLEEWLATGTSVAVLEPHEGAFRFAHDKLREALLSNLAPEARRALHRKVALALESVYGGKTEHLSALALHWGAAGDGAREARYSVLVGELAISTGAYHSAAVSLGRALELTQGFSAASARSPGRVRGGLRELRSMIEVLRPGTRVHPDTLRFERGRIEGLLAEAYYRMGDMRQFRMHGENALRLLGCPMPRTVVGLVATLPLEVLLRTLQSLRPEIEPSVERRAVLREAAQIQSNITAACMFADEALPSLWSGLRMLNLGDPAGPSMALVAGYGLMSMVMGAVPLHFVAESWGRRAIMLGKQVGELAEANATARKGVYDIYHGRWDGAASAFEMAVEAGSRLGDVRLWEEAKALLGQVLYYRGRLAQAVEVDEHLVWGARRSAHRQAEWWGIIGYAQSMIRIGYAKKAVTALECETAAVEARAMQADVMYQHGILALAYWRTGAHDLALSSARKVTDLVRRSRPVTYWNQQSTSAVAEVMLSALEGAAPAERVQLGREAKQAVEGLRGYARVFPFARPAALLWSGVYHSLRGRRGRALRALHVAVEAAERLEMPYEQGRAHLALARCYAPGDPRRYTQLRRARAILSRIGARADLTRVDDELGEGEAPQGGLGVPA
jgi:serine/threonine protein kinase/tetratricopeptide (TPR) repeat protein